jgi:hypothetical protein
VIVLDLARDIEMDRLDVDYGLARPAVYDLKVSVDAWDQRACAISKVLGHRNLTFLCFGRTAVLPTPSSTNTGFPTRRSSLDSRL